jgi:hypothetical protein
MTCTLRSASSNGADDALIGHRWMVYPTLGRDYRPSSEESTFSVDYDLG